MSFLLISKNARYSVNDLWGVLNSIVNQSILALLKCYLSRYLCVLKTQGIQPLYGQHALKPNSQNCDTVYIINLHYPAPLP